MTTTTHHPSKIEMYSVFAKNRYQDQLRHGDSENHPLDKRWQWGGEVLKGVAMTSSQILSEKIGMVTTFGLEVSNIDASKTFSRAVGHL